MGTSDPEMIASIKTSLKALYDTPLERLQAGEREAHFIKIGDLERSLAKWESKSTVNTSDKLGVRYGVFRYGGASS